jgi:hypothetical protein
MRRYTTRGLAVVLSSMLAFLLPRAAGAQSAMVCTSGSFAGCYGIQFFATAISTNEVEYSLWLQNLQGSVPGATTPTALGAVNLQVPIRAERRPFAGRANGAPPTTVGTVLHDQQASLSGWRHTVGTYTGGAFLGVRTVAYDTFGPALASALWGCSVPPNIVEFGAGYWQTCPSVAQGWLVIPGVVSDYSLDDPLSIQLFDSAREPGVAPSGWRPCTVTWSASNGFSAGAGENCTVSTYSLSTVPEPATLGLVGVGLLALTIVGARRRS